MLVYATLYPPVVSHLQITATPNKMFSAHDYLKYIMNRNIDKWQFSECLKGLWQCWYIWSWWSRSATVLYLLIVATVEDLLLKHTVWTAAAPKSHRNRMYVSTCNWPFSFEYEKGMLGLGGLNLPVLLMLNACILLIQWMQDLLLIFAYIAIWICHKCCSCCSKNWTRNCCNSIWYADTKVKYYFNFVQQSFVSVSSCQLHCLLASC